MVSFIAHDCLERPRDNKLLLELRIFKKEFQPILVSANVRLSEGDFQGNRSTGNDLPVISIDSCRETANTKR